MRTLDEPDYEESRAVNFVLNGDYPGCCGLAVIISNCVVSSFEPGVSAVRTIYKGTLILVWAFHSDVRFSVIHDETAEVDEACLVCKSTDVVQLPGKLWGALLPCGREIRVSLASDKALLKRLATIDVESPVDIIGFKNEHLASAMVVFRNIVPALKLGVYFGVQILNYSGNTDQLAKEVSLIPPGSPDFPADSDALISIQQIRPSMGDSPIFRSSLVLELNEGLSSWMPKSSSYHSFKAPEEVPVSRRQASKSLDLSAPRQPRLTDGKDTVSCTEVPPPEASKRYSFSRSLDLPSNTSNRKLARDRVSASLDSGSSRRESVFDKGPTRRTSTFERDSEIGPDEGLGVGSLAEFSLHGHLFYGVIRWIGSLGSSHKLLAGMELEEELDEDQDTYGLYTCPPFKALILPLSQCRKDSRFTKASQTAYGQLDCPVVEGIIPPISADLQQIRGKNKGIQGHHNSCYLDATLFAMFAFTSVFDSLLYRPRGKTDIADYEEVQRVLRDEIVNPLRRNLYVRADRVMKLRTLLEQLSSVTGLTSEEKDPEEFLNSLLTQILKADPFLQLSSGQEAFHYQLFVEKDERIVMPSVQQLLEQSFITSDIKLKRLPPCLIVQMPRFGKSFKMYPRIMPPTVLDVTDIIENSPRQCTICGKLAELECRECNLQGMEGGSFCGVCLGTVHNHPSRSRHKARRLVIPEEFRELQEHCAVPRLTMDLFAVVCIETSHYVSFLNTQQGWVFFDSMADRKGEQNGYNIPEITLCPELPYWLSEEGARQLSDLPDEKQLPVLAKRLLCDAYMCMYQSPDVLMYR